MEILTPFIVTQADIFTCYRSTDPSGTASKPIATLLYHSYESAVSVHVLFPIIIGTGFLDQ